MVLLQMIIWAVAQFRPFSPFNRDSLLTVSTLHLLHPLCDNVYTLLLSQTGWVNSDRIVSFLNNPGKPTEVLHPTCCLIAKSLWADRGTEWCRPGEYVPRCASRHTIPV